MKHKINSIFYHPDGHGSQGQKPTCEPNHEPARRQPGHEHGCEHEESQQEHGHPCHCGCEGQSHHHGQDSNCSKQEHGHHCNCEGHPHSHGQDSNCDEEHGRHCNCEGHPHHHGQDSSCSEQEHGHHCNCEGHPHHHEQDSNCDEEHGRHHHCGCEGHPCPHEHVHSCSCGERHGHQEAAASRQLSGHGKLQTYLLENLGCANCAAKMERKINDLDYIEDATITFATKQLKVITSSQEDILPALQEICSSIESQVKVVPKASRNRPGNPEGASGGGHSHGQEGKAAIWGIGAGVLLFISAKAAESMAPSLSIALYVAAYVILGGKIVMEAIQNLTHGQVFDENFLMSLATLGAFIIREYPEAVGVMLFYRIGEYFEHIAVEKSRKQIMDAVDMRPEMVNLVHGEEVTSIDAADANVGDILLVRPGDRIPLDGVIIEGASRIDTSPITGEPVPVAAKEGDSLLSGCVNTSGLIKIRVEKILEESMVTRILNSVENAAASKPKIDRFITRFARVYTPFVVALAAATAIIPSLLTGNWDYWVYTALTFLVISCPCALVLSVPLAFFSGIGAGSKRGILFKGGASLEAMNEIKAVVMDKTGTITKGNFAVQGSFPANGASADGLLSLCASGESTSTHPIAVSIVSFAKQKGLSIEQPEAVEEIAGKGIRAHLSQGELLCGSQKLMEAFQIDLSSYENDAYGTEVLAALNGQFIGHITIADTIKPEAPSAISSIKKLGISTAMLTGDSKENAEAIGREAGVEEIYAKLLPEDKLEHLQEIRKSHGAVMFVGDGINDAPVLAGADVGAAMGSGADAAIEAADVVFMASSMDAIPQALSIARASTSISRQNVIFALAIKALVMVLGLAGIASMWMAVFADSGVAMLCVLNSVRILYKK